MRSLSICFGSAIRTRANGRKSHLVKPATKTQKFCGHVPISPAAIPRFLKRFDAAYRSLGKTETILSTAAAHHRLLWILPFLDGNGRVARLVSHATLLETLDTGGVWSVARGLARNAQSYKAHLANCDLQRR